MKSANNSVTDNDVTDDKVTDNQVTENKWQESTPTWVSVAEEITAADFMSTSSSISGGSADLEIIEICERASSEFQMAGENVLPKPKFTSVTDMLKNKVPDDVLWPSLLTALQEAKDFNSLVKLCEKIKDYMPALRPRVKAFFSNHSDLHDRVAEKEIPPDGPKHLHAITTCGNGNCLCHALSHGYFNKDLFHIEIRVCIVIEGVLNRHHYLTDSGLDRGASYIHSNADLPTVFATFSQFYTPGQKTHS